MRPEVDRPAEVEVRNSAAEPLETPGAGHSHSPDPALVGLQLPTLQLPTLQLPTENPPIFEWALIGPNGLRCGWAILLFASIFYLFRFVAGFGFYAVGLVGASADGSASGFFFDELVPLVALIAAVALMSLFEDRRILDLNLNGAQRVQKLLLGAAAGFLAISLLTGGMAAGGWLHFSRAALPATQLVGYAALWGCVFLAVGLVEEGLFRCYGLATLARGINFWWALAGEGGICLYVAWGGGGHGNAGVYTIAALGLVPCFLLHRKAAASSAFWQAAWVTSTFFGFYHTSNFGETNLGVFAAAAVGFVFCVSVWLTGSAWWAIGCHAAWDWAETFVYGTADSGLQARGHLLSASPAGNPLWSGGTDGPEGSVLVLAAILVLLFVLIVLYGRKSSPQSTSHVAAS